MNPAPLGITTKSAAAPKTKTGKTVNKWTLQRHAQGLLRPDNYRVSMCQRGVDAEVVTIKKRVDGGAHFGNLLTCGSVWHCPVCAARITEGRRAELQDAIESATRNGLETYLATFTFRHHAGMTCEESIKNLSEGMRKLTAKRAYKKIMEQAGAIGAIRALEVTYSDRNGWHPHIHMLIFARPGALSLFERIREEWAATHYKQWGTTISQAGFDVRGGDYAAEYVAKFGATSYNSKWDKAAEVTKGHAKIARFKGQTPFGLLLQYHNGSRRAGALFVEYAMAFHGRRQLFWSRGLRDRLGVDSEQTDLDLATEHDRQPAEVVAVLSLDDWSLVIGHEARAWILQVAEDYGGDGVAALLEKLRGRPPSHAKVFMARRHFGPGHREVFNV